MHLQIYRRGKNPTKTPDPITSTTHLYLLHFKKARFSAIAHLRNNNERVESVCH